MVQTKEEYKAKQKLYRSSPEGKAKKDAYNNSPEGKAKQEAYRNSSEGKAKRQKTKSSPEYQARQKVYRDSPEVKERLKLYRTSPDARSSQKKYKTSLAYMESSRKYMKDYSASQKGKARQNVYRKTRYNQDPVFRSLVTARNIVRRAFLFFGVKKTIRSESVLGCSFQEFKDHIQSQWWPGMSWDNFGKTGWVVDHKIPLSSGNTLDEVLCLSRYINLQPLWSDDNSCKSDRLDWTPSESSHISPKG